MSEVWRAGARPYRRALAPLMRPPLPPTLSSFRVSLCEGAPCPPRAPPPSLHVATRVGRANVNRSVLPCRGRSWGRGATRDRQFRRPYMPAPPARQVAICKLCVFIIALGYPLARWFGHLAALVCRSPSHVNSYRQAPRPMHRIETIAGAAMLQMGPCAWRTPSHADPAIRI